MSIFSWSGSTGKQKIISLHGLSHEVCVAATQTVYWQQLKKDSSISITINGNYVPVELESICNNEDEPRLELIIQSQHEQDNEQFDTICMQINYDLLSFTNNDSPVYDSNSRQVIVHGSLFNSLPINVFDTKHYLLGQRNCNIKKIKNSFACAIYVDGSNPQRYRFTIQHEKHTIMKLAAVQIQALVRQAQYQYIIAFANKIGRSLVGPIERLTTPTSSSNSEPYPSFTSFEPVSKRKREDDEQQSITNDRLIADSDQSEDETIFNETRQQHYEQAKHLLNHICERMQARTPYDDVAKGREDSSQIKSYFRGINASKTTSNDSEMSIELVEHEKDLRSRRINEHKCTLVFNKQLKMGGGVRDRIKRTAKILAYEQLKTMTRNTPRENLILKPTRDGLWKAMVIKCIDNQ